MIRSREKKKWSKTKIKYIDRDCYFINLFWQCFNMLLHLCTFCFGNRMHVSFTVFSSHFSFPFLCVKCFEFFFFSSAFRFDKIRTAPTTQVNSLREIQLIIMWVRLFRFYMSMCFRSLLLLFLFSSGKFIIRNYFSWDLNCVTSNISFALFS